VPPIRGAVGGHAWAVNGANLSDMTDPGSFDEPPDENEAFANLDESLDDEDGLWPGAGPEGERELDTDIVVDRTELEEAGAILDDPERMSVLDGGIDDPDGTGPALDDEDDDDPDEAGWDVDPVTHGTGRRRDSSNDALDLGEIPDDADR
jgi:hypothetical protein